LVAKIAGAFSFATSIEIPVRFWYIASVFITFIFVLCL
jgi:hypothetical protein